MLSLLCVEHTVDYSIKRPNVDWQSIVIGHLWGTLIDPGARARRDVSAVENARFSGRMRTSRAFARSLPRRPTTTYPWSAAQLRPPRRARAVDSRVIIRIAVCPVGVRQQNHKYRTIPGSPGQRPATRNQVSLPTKQIIQYFLCLRVSTF